MATGNAEAAAIIVGAPNLVSEAIHAFLREELRRYFFIGGMPECVKSYADTGSMREAFEVQAEICETYRMDFFKYRPLVDRHCLNQVLSSVTRIPPGCRWRRAPLRGGLRPFWRISG